MTSPPQPASALPLGLTPYKRTADFNEATIPAGLLRTHSTKHGVWGRIHILAGTLAYRILDVRRQARESLLVPGTDGVVEPTILHEVEPRGPVRFFVEFLRAAP